MRQEATIGNPVHPELLMGLPEPLHREKWEPSYPLKVERKITGVSTPLFPFPSHGNEERPGIINTHLDKAYASFLWMHWSNWTASKVLWNLLLSFKFPLVLANNINPTETKPRQARIPRSTPQLRTSGKEKSCCKQQGCDCSWGI